MIEIKKAPAYPFKRGTDGIFKMGIGEDLTLMNLKTSILTGLGSLPMKKHIGSQIDRILFLPEDVSRDTLIKQYVYNAIEIFEVDVFIFDVISKNIEGKENQINLQIVYGETQAAKPKTASFVVGKGVSN